MRRTGSRPARLDLGGVATDDSRQRPPESQRRRRRGMEAAITATAVTTNVRHTTGLMRRRVVGASAARLRRNRFAASVLALMPFDSLELLHEGEEVVALKLLEQVSDVPRRGVEELAS